MSWFLAFLRSSIGSKVIAALTGVVLALFVIGHLAGNLLMFVGQDTINAYAEWLKSKPMMLWAARCGLLVSLVLHVLTVTRLQLMNRSARPTDYAFKATVHASLASRTMMVTGLLILLYVIYHLLHFTLGVTDPEAFAQTQMHKGVVRQDVYHMVIESFSNSILVVVVYIVANATLAWHLSHGISSLFQTLGFHDPRYNSLLRAGGLFAAAMIGAGYISIPLGVRFGLIR